MKNKKTNKKFKVPVSIKFKNGTKKGHYSDSLRKIKKAISNYQDFKEIKVTCKWGWGDNKAIYGDLKSAFEFMQNNYDDYKYFIKNEI